MQAPFPRDDALRLQDLLAYGILDTLPEEAYDDIARLAAHICGTPVSLVSLVDEERQWFKARHGMDSRETPREVSFCTHAILEPKDLTLVQDTAKDPRFSDNPYVTGEKDRFRFYAGAPLVSPRGHALGTLCVLDRAPRNLDEDQRTALRVLARQVMSQLELRRAAHAIHHVQEERLQGLMQIAHDLASPLLPMRFHAHKLGEHLTQDPTAARSLEALNTNLDWLERFVHDVRDLASLEAGHPQVHLENTDAAAAAHQILEGLREKAAKRNVGLEHDISGPLTARADPERLRQVLHNLVENSIKFTPPGGRVRVTARQDNKRVRIEVADTGRGLDAKDLERVFQPFVRVGEQAQRGSGLGLYVSRALSAAQGGRLWAKSAGAGKGSVFHLELPAASMDTPKGTHAPAQAK